MTGKVIQIRPEPKRPTADGLEVTEYVPAGIQIGNADIADSSQWIETDVQPGRGPLPIYPTAEDKEPLWRKAAGRCDAAAWVRGFFAIDPTESVWVMA